MITTLLLLGGLGLLVVGAEVFVRGAARLAAALGLSALVIGLTVVAYSTSAPELMVSVSSAMSGQGNLAVGNVVGSNTFNVLFILGVSALVAPLVVAQQLLRWDVPVMIGVSALMLVMGWDGVIARWEATILLVGVVAYTVWVVRLSKREAPPVQNEYEQAYARESSRGWKTWGVSILCLVGGLSLLVLGARLFIKGAVMLAQVWGVSDTVIGLTIVAAGTSLPEVAVSVMAAFRGQRDIVVGNVVGSNIFNILGVLSVAALAVPGGIQVAPSIVAFDLPVMIAVAAACLPIFFTGHTISRWEGLVFLGYYVAYTAYLVLDATGHDALAVYSRVMMIFVVPITVVTLGVVAWRAWGKRGEQGHIEPQRTAG